MSNKVTCKICKQEMRQITQNHLKFKHQMTLQEYTQKYPAAKTICEDLVQELKDKNSMNDSKNIKKIIDTKINRYGTLAVNNEQRLKTWRKNGHAETLSGRMKTDNPAKRSEVRKKISKGVTQSYINDPTLREQRKQSGFSMHRANGTYRSIMEEKGLWTPKSKKSERDLYYESVAAWTEWSYQNFFSEIENANKRSRNFHLDHKISKKYGFENDIDPAVIGHYENLQILPHSINESKGQSNSIDLSDLSSMIEMSRFPLPRRVLLTCGGAAGHMAHPYDDHGLTFNEMKELISRALEGQLDIEEAVTEKTDGQNLQVTWKNGQVGFARNKGTIKTPLTTQELINKFEGRGPISDAFREAGQDLQAAFGKIDSSKLDEIFKNGRVFANMEIIYPATKNVISYDKAHLQFHNLVEYDENANKVQTDMTGGALIQKIIEDANAHMQNTFSFIPPQKIKLGRIADFEDQQAALFAEVDQLKTQFGLKETDLISEYHRAWWRDVITTKAQELGYDISDDLRDTLVDRWAFNDKSTSITAVKKQIENPEFLQWVTDFDQKDFKSYQKQNMEPFESIFLRLGALVLSNVSQVLAANPSKSTQEIKRDIATLMKQVQQSKDPEILKTVETQLKRIEKLGGFEKIVPIEGIVFTFKGNTYKLTGAFAPVNQLIGILKYGR